MNAQVYEQAKQNLQDLSLSPQQYQQILRIIADALERCNPPAR